MSRTIQDVESDVESVVPQPSSTPMEEAQSVAIPPPTPPPMKFWHAPWTFAVHGVVGTCIFLIIAACAVGLAWVANWVETISWVPPFLILGLKAAEYTLFVTDLWLFVVFLWFTAKRVFNDMRRL